MQTHAMHISYDKNHAYCRKFHYSGKIIRIVNTGQLFTVVIMSILHVEYIMVATLRRGDNLSASFHILEHVTFH